MTITITTQQLIDAGACDEAIVAFSETYGESGTEEWTRERQIELLKGPLGKFVGWAWLNGLVPLLEMNGANLDGANLDGANLADDAPEGWEKNAYGRLVKKGDQ